MSRKGDRQQTRTEALLVASTATAASSLEIAQGAGRAGLLRVFSHHDPCRRREGDLEGAKKLYRPVSPAGACYVEEKRTRLSTPLKLIGLTTSSFFVSKKKMAARDGSVCILHALHALHTAPCIRCMHGTLPLHRPVVPAFVLENLV